jgi:hypothetical protein
MERQILVSSSVIPSPEKSTNKASSKTRPRLKSRDPNTRQSSKHYIESLKKKSNAKPLIEKLNQ